METKANHLLIGSVTLLGVLLAVGLGLWSASYRLDAAWQEFEIHFSQAVTGLAVGSVVQYNGINMGSVRELYLDPEDPGKVVAAVRVEADAPVREDTTARLTVNGLTGVSFIQLRGGSPQAPPLVSDTDQPPVIVAEESALQRLIDQSEDIVSTASEVMLRLLDFLSEENAGRVADTLDNIDAFTVALASEKDLIGDILRNVHQGSEQAGAMADELRLALADLRGLIDNVDGQVEQLVPQLAADLQVGFERFASAAERLDRVLAENEQAFSEFGNEALTQIGPAVQELRQLVRDLSRAGSRFERHPTRFLLGGDQPEEYQPQ